MGTSQTQTHLLHIEGENRIKYVHIHAYTGMQWSTLVCFVFGHVVPESGRSLTIKDPDGHWINVPLLAMEGLGRFSEQSERKRNVVNVHAMMYGRKVLVQYWAVVDAHGKVHVYLQWAGNQ